MALPHSARRYRKSTPLYEGARRLRGALQLTLNQASAVTVLSCVYAGAAPRGDDRKLRKVNMVIRPPTYADIEN